MGRLDDYQSALLAADPLARDSALVRALDSGGAGFVSFIVDHGLGPLWHERTGREEFRDSRMAAEALYVAQEHALQEIDETLSRAGIDYAVFKGAASRLVLYENPAVRACHDLDLIVRPADRVKAAKVLVASGFVASPVARNISRELLLSRGTVDIDLHWGLLREGRLRSEGSAGMLDRRQRSGNVWLLGADDALFVLLVHPAFAKHLEGWGMGLHRVADILYWLRTQSFDWSVIDERLAQAGVKTAAWATLRWVQLLTKPSDSAGLPEMLERLRPGWLRMRWLNFWLAKDLSSRLSGTHRARLLGFSLFLHDRPVDVLRALKGRYRAHRRSEEDLASFGDLVA
jgi:hypothetical protein